MNYYKFLLKILTLIAIAIVSSGCALNKVTLERVSKHCEVIDHAEVDVIPWTNPELYTTFHVYEFAPCLKKNNLVKIDWLINGQWDLDFGNTILLRYLNVFYPQKQVEPELLILDSKGGTNTLFFDVHGLHEE